MLNRLIATLSKSTIFKRIMATPAPRWLVLLVDMLIVASSAAITININNNAPLSAADTLIKTSIFVGVYLIFSLTFKTFQYIIRLSAIGDMYRIAMLCFVSSAVILIGSRIIGIFDSDISFKAWNIITVGLFSFSLMMVMRLCLKYIYTVFTNSNKPRRRVIMLGSAINSFVLAGALKAEADGSFDPVALLSLSDRKLNSTVSGIPVTNFDRDTVADFFRSNDCDTLLFLSTQIELMRSGFADIFLDNGIKLLMLNQVEEFDSTSDGTGDKAGSGINLSTHVHDFKIEDLLCRKPIENNNPNINRLIHDQVVMITGAAGSIGSEIVRQVARFKAKEIVLIDQAETPMHEMQLEMQEKFPDTPIHLFVGDITNPTRMERAFVKYHPRYVFHAAAYKHVPMMERNPSEAVMTNVFGTKNLADLAIKYNVEKFVMISTDKAVNPTNIMGASKRIAEIYVQSLFFHIRSVSDATPTRFITTRFGNVLGSNGSVIPLFRKQIEAGGPVTVTHRDIIRYFMTIPEACSLVLEAGCMGDGGEIYIFDMGKPVKIYDLATRMISLAGFRPGIDIKITETGLRPGEKLYEELLNDKETTLATSHNKIMIAKVVTYRYDDVIKELNLLRELAAAGKTHDMVAEMKKIVPEFISQNSIYHAIDCELDAKDKQALHRNTTPKA